MARLITGGTGLVGSELARILVKRGEEVVIFDRTIKRHRIEDIESRVKLVPGDLGIWPNVLNVIKENGIKQIYHIGSMLGSAAQVNPWAAFQANVVGTYNVLEAARQLEVEQMMFSSSQGTFNLGLETEISDTTIQRPIGFYGVGKLWGEGAGRFYKAKFGLDFRSIRYPAVVGPGDKTPRHWWIPMIENAVLNKSCVCPVTPETKLPMIFLRDAARAAAMVLDAPEENIKMVNYNVCGNTAFISAREIEEAIERHIPGTVFTRKPDPAMIEHFKIYDAAKTFDDSYARKEWGWKPEYSTIDEIITAFIKEVKAHPKRYGL